MNSTLSFEVLNRDLAGRVGAFKVKQHVIETPLLYPVINPSLHPLSPHEMSRDFNCKAIIANAYLLRKNYCEEVLAKGIHDFLGFNGVIMTDSGGYQILVYGDVNVSPEEIARFQEDIETDIAVILDIPTGWSVKRERAEYTVNETLRRANKTLSMLAKKDVLWVGPVQGGNHLDLVSRSATIIGKMPFDIFALGSPTKVVEQYLFDVLVDMIMSAKAALPVEKPFHLFGAGHPLMLSLAVALGCDLFDSAAYAIYARKEKYMTESGTFSLKDLQYFPCACKVCTKFTPSELLEMSVREREHFLAWHNLQACFAEIKRIKQAICIGRLWELVEIRARSHPAMFQALGCLRKYSKYLEDGTPLSKSKGLLYFDALSLARPEITRYSEKMKCWKPPSNSEVLVLLPPPSSKPFHRSKEYIRLFRVLSERLGKQINKIDFCVYTAPYGLIPLELDETYPLSQFEAPLSIDLDTMGYIAKQVEFYLNARREYFAVVFQSCGGFDKIDEACKRVVEQNRLFISPQEIETWSTNAIEKLAKMIHLALEVAKSSRDII